MAELSDTPTLRVLLLEDNPFDIELATETLRQEYACEVVAVSTGDDYTAALEGGEFDIVLSDFSLPNFSGIEALDYAQERAPSTPFVFVSGVLGEEHAVDMLKRGATDYVVKTRLSRLPLVVARAIGESRERRQRQLAERALRESEVTLSRVIESLQDYAVILLDADGTIRSWNGASQRTFGYEMDEVRNRPVSLLYESRDRADTLMRRELQFASLRGSSTENEWLARRDGSSFFANCVTTVVRDEDGRISGFSRIVRDTTAERTAAEALERAKLMAERANQAKDRFIAILSHELRTPLVPILTGTQLLEMNPAMPAELGNILAMIRRNVALEARLIDDLLDVTSIERGKLTLDLRPVDAHDVLLAALETTRDDVERKRIRLDLWLTAKYSSLNGDEARLQQVFWNLIRNAVKFTPSGGAISIRSENDGDNRLVITVRDSGIGISDTALARIFSPFEQADSARTPGLGGLGLGLAIARGLVLKHGGEIEAGSDGLGKGAVFTVKLPTASVPVRRDRRERSYDVPENNATYDLLLVEDNPDSEAALSAALEAYGHRVHCARSVAEAFDKLALHHFDALVSDIGLPDGSGLLIMDRVRGKMPAIALSGYGMEADMRASAAAGFHDHLIKPVDAKLLVERVHAVIASRSASAT